mgnify:FL=1|tara:strand:+ start:289 stop:813 length:525 start_codon:yes stop_codon:yes gene_type:complete
MLTHWNKLLNTDCTVVDIGPHTVYPIFRVGFTTLSSVCERKYVNKQIAECKHIDVMIRDPGDRFVSGINEYSRQNNLDVEETWKLVEQGKLVDRHFAPQYMWLLHLYKFYKGTVTILPFDHIKQITSVHERKDDINKPVPLLKSFLNVDYAIVEHYNETFELGRLIERYRNVLS